jgi:hypothetical protein
VSVRWSSILSWRERVLYVLFVPEIVILFIFVEMRLYSAPFFMLDWMLGWYCCWMPLAITTEWLCTSFFLFYFLSHTLFFKGTWRGISLDATLRRESGYEIKSWTHLIRSVKRSETTGWQTPRIDFRCDSYVKECVCGSRIFYLWLRRKRSVYACVRVNLCYIRDTRFAVRRGQCAKWLTSVQMPSSDKEKRRYSSFVHSWLLLSVIFILPSSLFPK